MEMKDLLSKELYCYEIYTLLMKSSGYPPSIDSSFYKHYPIPPHTHKHTNTHTHTHTFLQKYLEPTRSMIFRQKSQTPYK